jgi:6-phosphofructokinase 1
VDLAKVAGKTRVMPDEFIAASGSDITRAFRDYLLPLLGSGMPVPAGLRGVAIGKVLHRQDA